MSKTTDVNTDLQEEAGDRTWLTRATCRTEEVQVGNRAEGVKEEQQHKIRNRRVLRRRSPNYIHVTFDLAHQRETALREKTDLTASSSRTHVHRAPEAPSGLSNLLPLAPWYKACRHSGGADVRAQQEILCRTDCE
ncbi:unnamed protein product [Pleuronectes platessa]|uniref:Uncharacterized protein n=1 Tax=Pleuronectes platessa TaxID=8262 RepID=A0A9N7TPI7_PLEPL|nr:unnamed protein product [Pleuronectes platessa]